MNKRIMTAGLLAVMLAAQGAGAKTLEEVLKEKGVITETDYNEIMKDKPKTPPVSYKLGQGMTFTSPDEKFQLAISGQMQFRYSYFDNDGPGIGNKNEWRIRRLKTNFNGYTFTKDLTFKMNLNWANLLNNGNGSTVIEETYLNYRIVDEAQVRVGQDGPHHRLRVALAAVGRQDEDVHEVGEGGVVGDHAREGHLLAAQKAAEAQRRLQGSLDERARNAPRPRRLLGEEPVDHADVQLRLVRRDAQLLHGR